MYVLEKKATIFFASLNEREPNLPYYDLIDWIQTRFAFRELHAGNFTVGTYELQPK